jgi:cytochrome P450 family 3 subfamily A
MYYWLLGALSLILWAVQRCFRLSFLKRKGIPGPKPHLILGNLGEIRAKGFKKCYEEWSRDYGAIVGYYVGGIPQILISDPQLLRNIQIRDSHQFLERPSFIKGGIHPTTVSHGLFYSKPFDWKNIRQTVSQAFTTSRLKQLSYDMKSRVQLLIETLSKSSSSNNNGLDKGEVELLHHFEGLALDIMCRNAFGMETDAISRPDDPLRKIAKDVTHCLQVQTYLYNFNFLFPEISFIIYPIRYLLTFIWERFGWTSDGILLQLFSNALNFRRKTPEIERPNDLLQIMNDRKIREKGFLIRENDELESKSRDEKYLTENQIIGSSFTFLTFAYDTTSTTLATTAHFIVNEPQLQEDLRQEVKALLEKEGSLDYNVVNSLPLMDAVINESLRLFPPGVQATIRMAKNDYVYGNVTIPRGVGIFVGTNQLHRNPDLWPEPHKFDYTRFLGEKRQSVDPIHWQPFGAGPRQCLGLKFAMLEIKLCFAQMLLEFNFKPGPNTEKELLMEEKPFTSSPGKGVNVRLIPIQVY